MDLLVAAETGMLKGITLATGTVINYGDLASLEPKTDAITCMQWTGDDQTEVLCAGIDRQLRLFDCVSTESSLKKMFPVGAGEGDVKSALTFNRGQSIACASASGTIAIHDLRGKLEREWETGTGLKRMRRRDDVIVTTGTEHPLKLWDLSTSTTGGKPTFTAKNLPHDWLQLRVPVCDNDVRFIPRSQLLVTCTQNKEIRKYDPRAQRRPVAVMSADGEYPLLCLDVVDHDGNGEHRLIAGDTQGRMAAYDWRGKAGRTHVFKSFAGACRDLSCHPTAPLVSSVSLDRFARVHHVDDKSLVDKVYCKTRLSCLLMRTRLSIVNNGRILRAIDREPVEENLEKKGELVEKVEEGDLPDDDDDGADVWETIGTTGKKGGVVETAIPKEESAGESDGSEVEEIEEPKKKKAKSTAKKTKTTTKRRKAAEVIPVLNVE